MTAAAKKPAFETVTYRVRSKKRFALVINRADIEAMCQAGTKLSDTGRLAADAARAGAILVGIFVLPTNNVLELYRMPTGDEVGYLFTSFDVWYTLPGSVDYE